MTARTIFALLIFNLCFTSSAIAQGCNALLQNGVFNVSEQDIDLNSAKSYSQWFCDERFTDFEAAQNFGASIGVPFKGVTASLGFSSDSKQWKKDYSKFCATYQQNESLQLRAKSELREVSGALVDGFNKCLASSGMHAWLERTEDPTTFYIALKFVSPNAQNPHSTMRDSPPLDEHISCSSFPSAIDGSTTRVKCKRLTNDPVSIALNFDFELKGGSSLNLPAIWQGDPSTLPIFSGISAKCANLIAGNSGHLGCVHKQIGFALPQVDSNKYPDYSTKTLLYEGYDRRLNAGWISVVPNFRNGATRAYGYTVEGLHGQKDFAELFVLTNCGQFDGAVVDDYNIETQFQGCVRSSIGFIMRKSQ